MVIAVSFNKRLPPAAAAAGRGTLAELMAKSKEAASKQGEAMQMETPTIMQGIGKLANVGVSAWGQRKAEQDLDIQQAAQRKLMGEIDPLTGGTQEQIAAMGEFDPELMLKMWTDRASKLREDATRDNWQPLTDPAERAKFGIPADDTTPYKVNIVTGDFEPVSKSGSGVTVNTGEKSETEWEKLNSKQLSELVGADVAEGIQSTRKLGQIALLEKALPDMLSAGEGAVGKYLKENWNITLPGEKASNTQLFESIIDSMVPKERVEGSGTVSNFDAQRMLSAFPAIINHPEANAKIIAYIRGLAQRNQAVGRIAQQAQGMPREQARQFYFNEVNKLGDPLAGWDADVARMKKDLEKSGAIEPPASEAPAAPDAAAPGEPGQPQVLSTEPDPKRSGGGPKTRQVMPDGSTVIIYHDGTRTTIPARGK